MTQLSKARIGRRTLMRGAAAAGSLAAAGFLPGRAYTQAKTTTVNLQLGWIAGGNQLGEVCAKQLGYYEEEKLNLAIQPGGPSIDGVAIVASGRFEIGQVSSSPSLMLAASQKIPVKCFAVGAQEHPYTFFSLNKKPSRTPQDLVGKKVGIQATGKILLTAMLKKHNIPEDKVEVVVIGADMSPIMTGQVDVITGWLTNTTALRPLGKERVDLRLWDSGIQLYALPYYATQDTLNKKADMLAGFVRASAKGWKYAQENPEKAVDLLIKEYPNLVKADEVEAAHVMLKFSFTPATKAHGWGSMDLGNWREQIRVYDELKQFSAGPPKLEDVATTVILDATKEARPKIG
ncbi:MAG: ABC transporter substrate-binding protein [Alphaproteobacteria bacterium]|nr:ABC transporter substrate-binding protein [Alphaproteobacteria bacterium]